MNKQNPHKSSSDFKSFLANKLSDEALQTFQNQAASDEFEREAMEGYQVVNRKEALQALQEVESAIAKKSGTTTERKFVFTHWKLLGLAASLALFIVLGFGISQLLEKPNQFAKNEVEAEVENSKEVPTFFTPTASDEQVLPQNPTLDNKTNKSQVSESQEDKIVETKILSNESQKPISSNANGFSDSKVTTAAQEDMSEEEDDLSFITVSSVKESAAPAKTQSIKETLASEELEKYDNANYFQSGKLNFDSKKYNEALSYFEKSISNNQKVTESEYYIGMIYSNTNKNTKAIKYFDSVIASNTSLSSNAMWYKASLLIQKGDKVGAKSLLNTLANGNSSFKNQAIEKLKTLN